MKLIFSLIICFSIFTGCSSSNKPKTVEVNKESKVRVGAYYFDGWTGKTPFHMTQSLMNDFPERKPIWGWVTSTPEIVKTQVDMAADAGLDYFAFCWYYNSSDLSENRPENNALQLYINAPNKNRMKFCLLVANHHGNYITPENWPTLKKHWKKYFKEPAHLTVNGKPLIIFFEFQSMIKNFGSAEAVKAAFEDFRNEARLEGLPGLTIAACTWPSQKEIQTATSCGFDVLTGYNYHSAGLTNLVNPVSDMIKKEYNELWSQFQNSSLPYIPVSTLNWDVRPWSKTPETEKRFVGYSEESVYNSVTFLKKWIMENSSHVTNEKLGLLYAWNENGEGAWLTPSDMMKDSLARGLKRAILDK